jgi:hypothetical protein
MAEGGHVDHVGARGVDDDAADVMAVGEAEVDPGLAAVDGAEDAVAPRGRLAVVGLARAHVEDGGVGGGDRDVPDAGGLLVVEDGLEGGAVVLRLPQAAGRRSHVEGRRPGLDDGEIVDASAMVAGRCSELGPLSLSAVIHGRGRRRGFSAAGREAETRRTASDVRPTRGQGRDRIESLLSCASALSGRRRPWPAPRA